MPNFKGLYNNKLLLSSLEQIANHGASFTAGVSFLSAITLRPLAISMTPKVDSENKKILSIDSIASGIVKLLIALGVSMPIENTIKKINQNPNEFLNKNALKNLTSNDYDFLTQTIKLASSFISAIPKSILSVALVPLMLDFTSKKKQKAIPKDKNRLSFSNFQEQVNFKGKMPEKIISSIIESKNAQEFAIKHSKNTRNIARNITVATDTLLTSTGVFAIINSEKIENNKKRPLIANKILSSAISIFAGCAIDEIVQKLGKGFIENFKKANANSPKLHKYLEGLNIARPTLIFALIYYGIIPPITTFASDKLSKKE